MQQSAIILQYIRQTYPMWHTSHLMLNNNISYTVLLHVGPLMPCRTIMQHTLHHRLYSIIPYKVLLHTGTLTQSQTGKWLPAGKPDLQGQGIKNWNPRMLDQASGLQSPGQYQIVTPNSTILVPKPACTASLLQRCACCVCQFRETCIQQHVYIALLRVGDSGVKLASCWNVVLHKQPTCDSLLDCLCHCARPVTGRLYSPQLLFYSAQCKTTVCQCDCCNGLR